MRVWAREKASFDHGLASYATAVQTMPALARRCR